MVFTGSLMPKIKTMPEETTCEWTLDLAAVALMWATERTRVLPLVMYMAVDKRY